jgi:TPR repeat protein
VERDYAKAREWYEKAADKDNTEAMRDLGFLYVNGFGLAQDYTKAREWYEKAADKGNTSAMVTLGSFYCCDNASIPAYVRPFDFRSESANI